MSAYLILSLVAAIVGIIAHAAFMGFAVKRFKQTRAKVYLFMLIPLVLQILFYILLLCRPIFYVLSYIIIAVNLSLLEIITALSILWIKSVRTHIGTKTVKFFKVAFYFLGVAYVAAAIMTMVGTAGIYHSLLRTSSSEIIDVDLDAYTIVYATAFFTNIVGILFGVFSSIAFIVITHKKEQQYGRVKKVQAIRLMFMYIVMLIMAVTFSQLFVAVFMLIAFYLMNLLPSNALQHYGTTPEELIETTDSQV
ncbi:hypothetical protein BDF22DRAFT_671920 [Syncephalis plumigaleata]|nr:hypothetical protein BDF22DRAFT_671920 [Syncephalis plumigaleata]